ncbi:MAG: hypothetical protein DRJ42_29200 [Deltaproteobacteria bacterium]|nr:MAG: hypothetical protein DRJ42_29200 [Deltaproteobacteria bacterium]
MKTFRGLLLALPLAVLLGGCPIYTGDGGTVVPDSGPRPCVGAGCICDSSLDCEPGLVCTDNRCVVPDRVDACRTHGDCAVGAFCEDTRRECVDSATCTTDETCAGGFICDFRGTCVPQDPGQCRDQSDCGTGTTCVEGRCRTDADTCQFNYECSGTASSSLACVDNGCTAICGGDGDCAAGQTCQSGFCRATAECTSSSDCISGEHCVDARCLPDCEGSGACVGNEYCATDSFCRPAWQPTPFCSSDMDCAATSVCIDGACRTPCPTGTDEECRRFDVQLPVCASDNLCYSTNETMPECADSADCGDARSCVDGICRNE